AAAFKFQSLPFRQLHHKLLDKSSYVVVRDYFAFPLLDTEDLFRDLDLHILANLYLAGQPFMFRYFAAGQVIKLGGQYIATAGQYMTLAHGAGTTAAAGRRQKYVLVTKGRQ